MVCCTKRMKSGKNRVFHPSIENGVLAAGGLFFGENRSGCPQNHFLPPSRITLSRRLSMTWTLEA